VSVRQAAAVDARTNSGASEGACEGVAAVAAYARDIHDGATSQPSSRSQTA
jgi:hypothetical protein